MRLNRDFLFKTRKITQNLANRMKKLCDISVIFTMRTLGCLPALKSSFDKNLKTHVEYKVACN